MTAYVTACNIVALAHWTDLANHREIRKWRGERREALGVDHKRLLYCVNVNRTSLDHLLLGESADIDELSNETSITPDGEKGMYFV